VTDTLPTIDPRHTALLVMDFQVRALGAISEAGALLARVADAIAIVRDRDGHIAYVRVGFEDAEYDAVPAHIMVAPFAAAGRAAHSESPATAVHDHVAPQPGDIVVRKTRVGAFSTTDLDTQRRDREITTLILAGITTSGVALSTLRDAHDRDYRVVVLADATADSHPDVHDFLIEKIFPREAQVITIAELAALLSTDES
jgi:nicotinamidase-related amidase